MKLTDSKLRTLKLPPAIREKLYADGRGLYMRVRAARGDAAFTWQFRRKKHGQPTILTLGTYPALSLAEARRKAAELALEACVDSPTVQEAVVQWLTERVDPILRRADLVRGYVDRGMVPTIGSRRVREIRAIDIANSCRAYRDAVAKLPRGRADGRPAGRALLAVYRSFFKYCVGRGWVDESPAARVDASVIGAPQASRARVLTDEEIVAVMTTGHKSTPLLRFLLLTGLRIGEAFSGHREGDFWIVPQDAAKNGREHRVWLSELARAQLESYPWEMTRYTLQHRLTHSGKGWTAHDLRRTFATRLNELGIEPYVVERCLNHALGGVMGVYNRADYQDQRRAALDAWALELERLARPRSVESAFHMDSLRGP